MQKLSSTSADFLSYISTHAVGEDNAKTAKDLRYWGTARELRRMVREIRDKGFALCSNNAGYYAPTTRAELLGTIRRIESMAKSDLEVVRKLYKCLKNY